MAITVSCKFELAQPADAVWRALEDVASVAQCFPGASSVQKIDSRTCRGVVLVKLGPAQFEFSGQFAFVEFDPAQRKAVASAQGQDSRGRGQASSRIHLHVESTAGGSVTTVLSETELVGAVAQFGRAKSLIQAVSQTLIAEFARNLERKLAAAPDSSVPSPAQAEAAPQAPRPTQLNGLALAWAVFVRWIRTIVGSRAKTSG